MSQQGASPKILGNIDAEIEKIEKTAKQMQNQIAKGFSSSREIKTFDTQVDNLYKGLENIQDSFKQLNASSENFLPMNLDKALKDLKTYKKQLTDLQKTQKTSVARGLKGVGYSPETAKETSEQIKNEKDLTTFLTQEYEKRYKARENARRKYNEERKKSDENIAASSSPASMSNIKSSDINYSQEDLQMIKDGINKTFREGLLKTNSDFKQIWNNITDDWGDFIEEFDDGGDKLKESVKKVIDQRDKARVNLYNQYGVEDAKEAQRQLGTGKPTDINWSPEVIQIMEKYKQQLTEIQNTEQQVITVEQNRDKVTEELNTEIEENNKDLQQQATNLEQNEHAIREMTNETIDATDAQNKLDGSFDSMRDRAKQFLSIGAAISGVKRVIQSTFNSVKELDEAFASIALVTSNTVEGMWQHYGEYAEIANELGQSTKDVISSSALYIQQGLSMNEALELSTDTMKMARLAQIDYSNATSYMTSA